MKEERVSLSEAKARLSELVNVVAYGEGRVLILSHGKPKALLLGVRGVAPRSRTLSGSGRMQALARAETFSERLGHKKKWTPLAQELLDVRRNVQEK